jgi:predicted GIY-YIG superfamily endonuclease
MSESLPGYDAWRAKVLPTQYTVYFLYSGDELLYVGCTNNLDMRLRDHWRQKPWMASVDRIELQTYNTRKAAGRAEHDFIRSLRPRHSTSFRLYPTR